MATINYTATAIGGDPSALKVTWGPMTAGDIALPLGFAQWVDRSVQVEGTFSAANASMHGSNSGNTYVALSDTLGNTLSITAAGIKQISEQTATIKPVLSGGDGTTALTFTVVCRRTQPLSASAPIVFPQ